MLITMICWGSWANLAKIEEDSWRFELFYWDYAWGVLLCSILLAFTLGSFGRSPTPFIRNLSHAGFVPVIEALASGVLFNVANILLVAAISIAGMAVAFPIGIGLALVLGTTFSYFIAPIGSATLLFLGVFFVLLAIILDALAYRRAETESSKTTKGIGLSILCGILMSFFYPLLADSMVTMHGLTPYSALVFFAIGVVICNFFVNTFFMKRPISGEPLTRHDYFAGTPKQHLWGVLAGVIWCLGTGFNLIASTRAGPAIAYAFGQGATLIAAIWGVFIWKELKDVENVNALLTFMFICYVVGLFFIGIAKVG